MNPRHTNSKNHLRRLYFRKLNLYYKDSFIGEKMDSQERQKMTPLSRCQPIKTPFCLQTVTTVWSNARGCPVSFSKRLFFSFFLLRTMGSYHAARWVLRAFRATLSSSLSFIPAPAIHFFPLK